MKQFAFGFGPKALRRRDGTPGPAPFTAGELARIGIPARKISRVQAELARLAPQLPNRAVLLKLAKEIAKQLL